MITREQKIKYLKNVMQGKASVKNLNDLDDTDFKITEVWIEECDATGEIKYCCVQQALSRKEFKKHLTEMEQQGKPVTIIENPNINRSSVIEDL